MTSSNGREVNKNRVTWQFQKREIDEWKLFRDISELSRLLYVQAIKF